MHWPILTLPHSSVARSVSGTTVVRGFVRCNRAAAVEAVRARPVHSTSSKCPGGTVETTHDGSEENCFRDLGLVKELGRRKEEKNSKLRSSEEDDAGAKELEGRRSSKEDDVGAEELEGRRSSEDSDAGP
ncbi:hypothetical protein NDU88_007489 [Pleurodeles waltl]|uniref:Uncharacterized protein n=1 Tax=Pleurodeles waltl TaxID=8319 RepID=A0AAV7LVL5_PLEWA|nr:hypothetical protein NDU88_007489 [Pleurodeles waltl]